MARRRYYRRVYRSAPRKKWATSIKRDGLTVNMAATGQGHAESVLVSNSTQSASPTPVIIKTGNFKIQGDCYVVSGSDAAIQAGYAVTLYVMYLPEVVVASANVISTINDHPEWIMAWKVIDLGVGQQTSNGNSFSFSSRLKRNLNSGDTVALVAIATGPSGWTPTATINFTAQYWTCSN